MRDPSWAQAVEVLKRSCLAKDLLKDGMEHNGEDGRDADEEGKVVRLSSAVIKIRVSYLLKDGMEHNGEDGWDADASGGRLQTPYQRQGLVCDPLSTVGIGYPIPSLAHDPGCAPLAAADWPLLLCVTLAVSLWQLLIGPCACKLTLGVLISSDAGESWSGTGDLVYPHTSLLEGVVSEVSVEGGLEGV
eukprot:554531-Prorocentrum_minimum.AAC.5